VLEDNILPVYDISDGVAITVRARPPEAFAALLEIDLIDLVRHRPVVGLLSAVRVLPSVLAQLAHGERPAAAPERLRLKDAAQLPARDGGWILLGERAGEAIALGMVGRLWRPVIDFADVSAAEFRDFDEPGYAKTVFALAARPAGGGEHTVLTAVMRTATTDEHARRWFRRYWTLGVGSGAHMLVAALLEAARERAEGKP
jgi:hypothetical protein